MDKVVVDFQEYHAFSLPGEAVLFEEGRPSVPQITRYYRIPNSGSVELNIANAAFDLIENVNPLPVQSERKDFDGFTKDVALYQRDEWYPSAIARISEPMLMRELRVVMVTLYPVQVNPVTHQARVYHTLDAEIVANSQPGVNELLHPRQPSISWVPIYQNLIANLDDDALLNARRDPGSYLIICKNNANPLQWVDSLKTWKKRQGYDVIVDARNNWTVNTMVTAIQTAYEQYDPPLEFVCLIGDPQWQYGVPTSTSQNPYDYDHAFALGNAGDELEDIGVGRLSGSSISQFATINAKIMAYERDPAMLDSEGNADTIWFHRSLYIAGTTMQQPGNILLHHWSANQYATFTGVDSSYLQTYASSVNVGQATPHFASGLSFFHWQGNWIGEMQTSFAPTMPASRKLPVVIAMSEGSNMFDNSEGVAESFLTAGTMPNPKGGVCAIGSSIMTIDWGAHVTFTGAFDYGVANLGIEHVSTAMSFGKMWIAQTFGWDSPVAGHYWGMINLMGEPSISMWTDVPTVMTAIHPPSLDVGTRGVTVTVLRDSTNEPIADALVVLWKGDETFVRGLTDSWGLVELPVTIDSTGDLLLTVTKRNHKPYLYTIPCVNSLQHVAVCGYTLDDDNTGGTQGNGQGDLNPGEIIDLSFCLSNYGTDHTAHEVFATLVSNNPHITVTIPSTSAPDLAPGDSAASNSPLRIEVSPTMSQEELARLTLHVTTSDSWTDSPFELECRSGKLAIWDYEPAGPFNPGMTQDLLITLTNVGVLTLNDVSAHLFSLTPYLTVSDADAGFGTIVPSQNVTNSDPFTISASAIAPRGYAGALRLVTSTPAGPLDTLDFSVNIGTATTADPTGPDAYGYFAYDNSDTTYESFPVFEYVDIADEFGTDLNLNDHGWRWEPTQITSFVRALPFPFMFYGQLYDTVTVCSNGWIAFGNQGWNDAFRNYPIPGILAPDAMIAAYWDDLKTDTGNLGVWDYFDDENHRYIVQWKAHGAETFTPLDFEIILLDEAEYPTWDNNGKIIVQYEDVTMNLPNDDEEPPGSTIGIQAPGGLIGLQYAYIEDLAAGAAPVADGRAIMFTTNNGRFIGHLEGTVTDSATGLPLAGAAVTLGEILYATTTDEQGFYRLDSVLVSTYRLDISIPHYNRFTVPDLFIELDSTLIINAALLHPELVMSVDTLAITLPGDPLVINFDISNSANGPLYCELAVGLPDDSTIAAPWDSLLNVPVSELTGDPQMHGVEFFANQWWVTGSFGTHGGNNFYIFSPEGSYVESVAQPGMTLGGWFDLATDGQYLYGSDSDYIIGIDSTGTTQDSIPCPTNPALALAYDPESDHFWVGNYVQNIWEITREGEVIQEFDNSAEQLLITGLAWHEDDPQGYKLYLFSYDGPGPMTRVTRVHPATGERELVTYAPGDPAEHAGGCTITRAWNGSNVFAAILQDNNFDVMRVYLLDHTIGWVDIQPLVFTVPGGGSQNLTATFDPEGLRPMAYQAVMSLRNEVLDTTVNVPIILSIAVNAAPNPGLVLPTQFSLHQNYPNPFNPATEIVFDLPVTTHVELDVFNTLGQRVARLVDGMQPAGTHRITWKAAQATSGLYLYRLHAGDFVKTRKMILLR